MKYFAINELCQSSTATRLGIKNNPTEEIKSNLTNLIDKVLDPLREAYGSPIIVSSGYRCKALNKAVGGSQTSQHASGEAADITAVGSKIKDNKKLFDLVRSLELPFDQLIYEYGDKSGPDWVHVSFSSKRMRKQILRATKVNGKTSYQNS